MDEKKSIKVSFQTAVFICITIVLFIAITIIYIVNNQKTKDFSSNNTINENIQDIQNQQNNTNENNTITKEIVNSNKNYGEPLPDEGQVIIKDGYLYYSKSENTELKKIEGISEIKSIYVCNVGTAINKVPFIISNDGTVYRLNSEEQIVEYEELSNYKVSEIIDHNGETSDIFTLLLIDGTKKIVEVKHQ